MKTYHLPSGLHHGLDFLICPDWTPEQAMAVIELLEDLRDRIWAHYELQLLMQFKNDRITSCESVPDISSTDDPPF